MAVPTGQGQSRGLEDAEPAGSPLSGTRATRAAANDAQYGGDGYDPTPRAQGGHGKENMLADENPVSGEICHPADAQDRPDLMALGDPGQTFGGS